VVEQPAVAVLSDPLGRLSRVTRRQHRERLRRRLREHVEVATEFAPLAVDLGKVLAPARAHRCDPLSDHLSSLLGVDAERRVLGIAVAGSNSEDDPPV